MPLERDAKPDGRFPRLAGSHWRTRHVRHDHKPPNRPLDQLPTPCWPTLLQVSRLPKPLRPPSAAQATMSAATILRWWRPGRSIAGRPCAGRIADRRRQNRWPGSRRRQAVTASKSASQCTPTRGHSHDDHGSAPSPHLIGQPRRAVGARIRLVGLLLHGSGPAAMLMSLRRSTRICPGCRTPSCSAGG